MFNTIVKRTVLKTVSKTVPKIVNKRQFTTEVTEAINAALPLVTGLAATGAVGGAGYWASMRYHVSQASEYIVKTGLFVDDIHVSKTTFQWPFQQVDYIDMSVMNCEFDLHAMSAEKLEFALPGVFTIGPKNDPEAIKTYARLLSTKTPSEVHETIKGVIEGETRILAARMSLEQIFDDRKELKDVLINGVQLELNDLGLQIHNANIKELTDAAGSEYFSFLRQNKRSQAENRAKIDIAEAKKNGDIGQKQREAMTRQQTISIEAETVVLENLKQQEIQKSKADLAVVFAETKLLEEVAKINAKIKEAQVQQLLEQQKVATETERLRASELSQTQVDAEKLVKTSEGNANAAKLTADASLYSEQRKADGVAAVYSAQAEGIEKLVASFNNDIPSFMKYLYANSGLTAKLAETNAEAIQGLNPKITVWGSSADENGYTSAINSVLKMVPPVLEAFGEQKNRMQ